MTGSLHECTCETYCPLQFSEWMANREERLKILTDISRCDSRLNKSSHDRMIESLVSFDQFICSNVTDFLTTKTQPVQVQGA
jgi:hypothetical protein